MASRELTSGEPTRQLAVPRSVEPLRYEWHADTKSLVVLL